MLVRAFSGLSVSASSAPAPRRNPSLASTSSVRGTALTLSSSRSPASAATPTARGSVVVFAKQNALQRQRLAEKQRVYNKARKSAVATRIKKVLKAVVALGVPTSEEDIKPVEVLISEATKEIDKAVQKGVLHANTGARRKARMAAAKRNALIKGGLYTPA